MSPVREAVEAVLKRWADTVLEGHIEPLGDDMPLLVADLADAVNAVPMTVTVRDLEPMNNQLTFTGGELNYLAGMIGLAADRGELILAVGPYLKVWSGTAWSSSIQPESGARDE